MCLICSSINKNQLTLNEAWKNLHEMYETIEEDHIGEILDKMLILAMAARKEKNVIPPFEEWDEWYKWGPD